jgi:hypothetical protein
MDGEGNHLEGIISKAEASNVFYCDKDNVTILNKSENHNCPFCSDSMTNIGWVEKSETENEMIKGLLAKFKGEQIEKNGGTETMAEAVAETVEPLEVEKSDTAEVIEAVSTDAPAEVVKSEAVEETSTEAPVEVSFEKGVTDAIAALVTTVGDIAKALETVAAQVETVTKSVGTVQETLNAQESTVESIKESSQEVAKRLDAVEDDTAVKKSAEVGPSDDGLVQKSSEEVSFWGNRFVSI